MTCLKKLEEKIKCLEAIRKNLEKELKQEDFDFMTERQKKAMAYAVTCAIIGAYKECISHSRKRGEVEK